MTPADLTRLITLVERAQVAWEVDEAGEHTLTTGEFSVTFGAVPWDFEDVRDYCDPAPMTADELRRWVAEGDVTYCRVSNSRYCVTSALARTGDDALGECLRLLRIRLDLERARQRVRAKRDADLTRLAVRRWERERMGEVPA